MPSNMECQRVDVLRMRVFRDYVHEKLAFAPVQPRSDGKKRILLVQRSKSRGVRNFKDVLAFFESKREFEVEVFRDQRMPGLQNQLKSFYMADAIFAPHGAGLSNLLAARKSVVVAELLERPIWDVYVVTVLFPPSLCSSLISPLQNMARALQLRYLGIQPKQAANREKDPQAQLFTVNHRELERAYDFFVQHLFKV